MGRINIEGIYATFHHTLITSPVIDALSTCGGMNDLRIRRERKTMKMIMAVLCISMLAGVAAVQLSRYLYWDLQVSDSDWQLSFGVTPVPIATILESPIPFSLVFDHIDAPTQDLMRGTLVFYVDCANPESVSIETVDPDIGFDSDPRYDQGIWSFNSTGYVLLPFWILGGDPSNEVNYAIHFTELGSYSFSLVMDDAIIL